MQGEAKILLRIKADNRNYEIYLPSDCNAQEVISVCKHIIDLFNKEIRKAQDEEKSEEKVGEEEIGAKN